MRDRIFLMHMLESIEKIERFVKGFSKHDFLEDEKTQDAVIRRIEAIGEAAKNVSKELKQRYHHIPWKEISGSRDAINHKYLAIDLDMIWEAIKDLPGLKKEIKNILKSCGK